MGQVCAPVRADSQLLSYWGRSEVPDPESPDSYLLKLISAASLCPAHTYGITADTWFEKPLSTLLESTAVTT